MKTQTDPDSRAAIQSSDCCADCGCLISSVKQINQPGTDLCDYCDPAPVNFDEGDER